MDPNSLIIVGAILIVAFVVLNLFLQPRWFPHDTRSSRTLPAGVAPSHSAHFALGLIEVALFSLGAVLIICGFVIIGTTHGYG